MARIAVLAGALVLAALAALAAAPTSRAVGPSLPAVDGPSIRDPDSSVSYVTRLAGSSTTLLVRVHSRAVRRMSLAGRWGIQMATLSGTLTGLSPDGRVLVLSDNVNPGGTLRAWSRLAVIDTRQLKLERTVTLPGDYSVDALSPHGGFLYLIHHISRANATKYQVKGYDLTAGVLLPGVIADKSQAGWVMAGYPVTRVATRDGGWVYTLYRQDNGYPFIHSLDTVHHVAHCVGLPARPGAAWISAARLRLSAGSLAVRTKGGATRFHVDTATFRVTTGR